MRKFTKLLAIVMIACLLCGVIAVTVGAADTAAESFLNISNADKGITTQKYQDFNGENVKITSGNMTDMNGKDLISANYTYGTLWNWMDAEKATGIDGNYLNLKHKSNRPAAPNKEQIFTIGINPSGTSAKLPDMGLAFQKSAPVGSLRAMTVDLDICATEATFTVGGTMYTVTEVLKDESGEKYVLLDEQVGNATETADGKYKFFIKDADRGSYRLSYGDITFASHGIQVKADGTCSVLQTSAATLGGADSNRLRFFRNTTDGSWGLGIASASTTPVADTPGAWNHITIVYYTNEVAGDTDSTLTTKVAYYLDGNHITTITKNWAATTYVAASIGQLRLAFSTAALNPTAANTSIGVDNIAINTYAVTEAEATWDANAENKDGDAYKNDGTLYGFYKSGDITSATPSISLNELTDVLYNKDTYLNPNELHTITVGDGTPVRYATQAKLIEALKVEDGTTSIKVKTTQDLFDYAIDDTIVDALENPTTVFTVEAPKVTLHEDFSGLYSAVEDKENPGNWTISKATHYFYVQFCDAEGNPIEDVKIQALAANQLPANALKFPAGYDDMYETEVGGVTKYGYYTWEYENFEGEFVTFDHAFTIDVIEENYMDYSEQEFPMPVYLKENIDENKVLVTWKAPNGEGFKREWINKTTKLPHPVYEEIKADAANRFFEAGNNGWYDKYYTTWVSENGGETLEYAEENTVFVVDQTKFVPVLTAKTNIKGIRYNFRLTGNSTLRVFAPFLFDENGNVVNKADASIPDDIEYVGIFSAINEDAKTSSEATLVKNGDTYLQYGTGTNIAANNFTKALAYLGFKVKNAGSDNVLYYEIGVSFADYAEDVLAKVECGSEEAVLVISGLEFIENNTIAAGRSVPQASLTRINAIKEAHATCACRTQINALKANASSNAEDNVAGLKTAGVESVEYQFDLNRPGIIFNVLKGNVYQPSNDDNSKTIYKIVVKYNGIGIDGQEYGEQVYESTFKKNGEYDETYTIGNAGTYNTYEVYYKDSAKTTVRFRINNVAMHDATAKFTIEVYNKEGDLLGSGTHSISDYIAANADTIDAKFINAAKGLYVFAEACLDYKVFTDAEKAAGETAPNPFL